MKIRVADSTGCPVPQFIVEAESEKDRMILKSFTEFRDYTNDKWEFNLHGVTYSGDVSGPISFNFGWTNKNNLK